MTPTNNHYAFVGNLAHLITRVYETSCATAVLNATDSHPGALLVIVTDA
jgi:hypothetical protein